MRFLRRGTAVNLTVGPAYNKTDGVTPETNLNIPDEKITFAYQRHTTSAATLPLNNQAGSTSDSSNTLDYLSSAVGLLRLRLTATDLSTQGSAMLIITNTSAHVPIFHEFVVLEESRYDALVEASTGLSAHVASFAATPLLQLGIIGQGTAQQSSSNSLTLASTTAYVTDEINGATLLAAGGQPRTVTAYDSTSKIATVDAYVVTPSSLATYLLFATPPSSPTSPLQANVTQWNGAAVATPTQAGVPEVDVTYLGGAALASTSAQIGAHVVTQESSVTTAIQAGLATSTAMSTSFAALTTSVAAVGATLNSTAVAAEVLNSTVDGAYTLREVNRGYAAVLLGLVSGSAGSTTTFRDINDVKNRVVAVTDTAGNRTAITLDLT
jgi:hypothetical protein